jgi:hypothetical protein
MSNEVKGYGFFVLRLRGETVLRRDGIELSLPRNERNRKVVKVVQRAMAFSNRVSSLNPYICIERRFLHSGFDWDNLMSSDRMSLFVL